MSSMDNNTSGQELQHHLQKLKIDILRDVEGKINQAMDQLYDVIDSHKTSNSTDIGKHQENVKRKNCASLPRKEFYHRNSPLTDLFKVTHLQSIYNICAASLFLLILKTIFLYACDSEKLIEDLEVLSLGLGKFSTVVIVWLGMNLSIVGIVYPCLRFWSSTRQPRKYVGYYDIFFGLIFIIYQLMLFYIPALIIISHNIPQISTCIIVFEQVRLIMKVHAFLRENISYGINYKPHQDDNRKPYPELKNLIYFLFAPTFVYRDNYPRTSKISWKKVLIYFIQFVACIFTSFVPFCRFLVTTFSQVGLIQFTKADIILIQTKSVLVGGLMMFLIFYGMLHCWLNMFAEMLRFADRQFYLDWWNSTSYAQYYRTWNSVVHDWLYMYVYRDVYHATRNKLIALFTVFFVSAIIHEYILIVSLRFFFPILFFLFGTFGVWVMFLTRQKTASGWNIFLWIGLFFGWGLMISLYSFEWYSRINCPSHSNSWTDYVIPRTWSCIIK